MDRVQHFAGELWGHTKFIHLYVYQCIHRLINLHNFTHINLHICSFVPLHPDTFVHSCFRTFVRLSIYTFVLLCVYTIVHVYTPAHSHVLARSHAHTHTHTWYHTRIHSRSHKQPDSKHKRTRRRAGRHARADTGPLDQTRTHSHILDNRTVTSRSKAGTPVSRATHDRCRPPDATLLTFVLDFWNGLIVHTRTHTHIEAIRHQSARGWGCIGWCRSSGLTSTFCRLTIHARPLKRIAHSTTLASNKTTSVSKDNAAQGGVRAQTLTPLRAGKMNRYRPKSRRAPPCQKPPTLVAGRLMQPCPKRKRGARLLGLPRSCPFTNCKGTPF